jgi:broad specificity phosphatase PhoE
MALEIVYETHSPTLDNDRGFATGWNHGELSEWGRGQARELGERHAGGHIDVVYTSDLRRATDTAEIAFGEQGVEIRPDARLRECNYGEWNGARVDRIHTDRGRYIDVPYPGGETYRQVVERMRDFLADIAASDAKRVVLISHRAPWYAMEHLLNGVPLEEIVTGPFEWQPGWRYVVA